MRTSGSKSAFMVAQQTTNEVSVFCLTTQLQLVLHHNNNSLVPNVKIQFFTDCCAVSLSFYRLDLCGDGTSL
eukprot:m.11367 g.11367  ORF g.11367 m.11367 type:complete len:72 (+) comp6885_c0_seq1:224-439(+)